MDIDALELFLRLFSRALMLLLVMPVTNCARGLTAKRMGDDTAEKEGRITLNPFVHLDLLGSLMIMLIGFGWSKPLPINFAKMKDRKKGIIAVSAAGPLSHFISAILCYIVLNILFYAPAFSGAANEQGTIVWALCTILSILGMLNSCLGAINLLPLPPMDGFNILSQLMGNSFHRWYFKNYINIQRISMFILIALFWLPSSPLKYYIFFVDSIMQLAASWVPHMFG